MQSIFKQLLLDLGISLLIFQDKSGDTLQSIFFLLGLLFVTAFVASMIKSTEWQQYVLWRVGDFMITDLSTQNGILISQLAFATMSAYTFIYMLLENERSENVFIELVRLLAASTTSRALLDVTKSLPPIDLIFARLLIVTLIL